MNKLNSHRLKWQQFCKFFCLLQSVVKSDVIGNIGIVFFFPVDDDCFRSRLLLVVDIVTTLVSNSISKHSPTNVQTLDEVGDGLTETLLNTGCILLDQLLCTILLMLFEHLAQNNKQVMTLILT